MCLYTNKLVCVWACGMTLHSNSRDRNIAMFSRRSSEWFPNSRTCTTTRCQFTRAQTHFADTWINQILSVFLLIAVRTRPRRQRHVRSSLQQASEADVAGGLQYRVYDSCWSSKNVEFSSGMNFCINIF